MNKDQVAYLSNRLQGEGYEDYHADGTVFQRRVGEEFGMKVRVRLRDWDKDYANIVTLDSPLVSVMLPHQCDSWEIVSERSPERASELMRQFLQEADEAETEVQRLRELLAEGLS